VFQARLVQATSALLGLLETDSAARFVWDGQTILLADALQVQPGWRQRLASQVAAARLDIGPWYILGDEQIPAAESLIRNLLEGAHDSGTMGARLDVLYSPDAFGHPAALPMIARQFGISHAVVWRGLAPAGADRDLYRWSAPDGSAVTLYHLPPSGYEIGVDLLDAEEELPARWGRIRDGLLARSATAHIGVFVGADHHAPPTQLTPLRDRLQQLEPEDRVVVSSLAEFVGAVDEHHPSLPLLAGELRAGYGHTWTLQGVHATRGRMRIAEPLCALAGIPTTAGMVPLLRHARRLLLASQFHDTIGGCCSDAVAAEQDVRLGSVQGLSEELASAARARLVGHDADAGRRHPERQTPTLWLWNPTTRARSGVTMAEITVFRSDVVVGPPGGREPRTGSGYHPVALRDDGGNVVATQMLHVASGLERINSARHYPDQDAVDRVRIAFVAPRLGGLGFGALRLADTGAPHEGPAVTASARRLVNRHVQVDVDAAGRVTLTDRVRRQRYRDVVALVDERDVGDTYSPCLPADAPREAHVTGAPQLIAAGPLVGAIAIPWTVASPDGGTVTGRTVLCLYADSPIVRIRIEADNQAKDHRLRLRCDVGTGTTAIAGAAFGYEVRAPVDPSLDRDEAEWPVRTAPAHHFVAVAGSSGGLGIVTPGFAEYEWTESQQMWLTLWRSTGELSRNDLPSRPGHAGWPMATPLAQELGPHTIEVGLVPLGRDAAHVAEVMECHWEDTFLPLQPTFLRQFTTRDDERRLPSIALHGDGLVFSSCKPAETGRGIVLRCYNSRPDATMGSWNTAFPISRARLARADEHELEAVAVIDQRRIEFNVAARGISTITIFPQV
jgi:mannosylglycerate hydrolase